MKKMILFFLCLPFVSGAQMIITTVAGNGTAAYLGDGTPATSASLNSPAGIVTDSSGNIYIGDGNNNAIRKISPSGIITTIAGNGTAAYGGDGGPATAAELSLPLKMLLDKSGNLIFADYQNHRVRKISTTGIITTIAGNGTPGYTSDNVAATASSLYYPSGIALDTAGNLFIADYYNHRVRKVSTTGIITTAVGTGSPGSAGDGGPATAAQLFETFGIAIDNSGNLYLADAGTNKVRKVSATGIISTFAGTGTAGYTTDGVAATASELDNPAGVSVDNAGNVYIADQFNNRIRMVSSSGMISTLAGNDTAGFRGDNGPATGAELNDNNEVFFDNYTGALYLTDNLNNRVRRIVSSVPSGVSIITGNYDGIVIFPNPTRTELTITDKMGITSIIINNLLGQTIYSRQYSSSQVQIDVSDLAPGLYFVQVNGGDVRRFVKE